MTQRTQGLVIPPAPAIPGVYVIPPAPAIPGVYVIPA